ncbi:hypothetical protein P154DRAFT_580514 [Amniculicola lignicola CBS 123094]|uniref:Uncharacterized protein n=1 Tax=Amniculicola lignicola CBS 123094 TaxID=1392246 RepID=A0A6A5W4G9_9PLEO|nr:hypothetical protein P154DRAFT_580514 [Amniculicola lignicola CBS 123094]
MVFWFDSIDTPAGPISAQPPRSHPGCARPPTPIRLPFCSRCDISPRPSARLDYRCPLRKALRCVPLGSSPPWSARRAADSKAPGVPPQRPILTCLESSQRGQNHAEVASRQGGCSHASSSNLALAANVGRTPPA